jgi:hypothetical protein
MLRYFPVHGKVYLAVVLYHEIGHHYRRFTHGISAKDNEKFADEYRDKIFLKDFYYLRLFKKPYKFIATLLGLTQQKKDTPLGSSCR